MLTPEQIEARAKGIGASEAAVVAGLSPRMTALELYLLKRGELVPDEAEDELAWLGNAIEPVTHRWYEANTGRKLRRSTRTWVHRRWPFMLAHPDRLVVGEPRGAEFKMRVYPDGWGPPGSDEVPDETVLQAQQCMACTRRQIWDVVVLIGGREFRRYEVPRDDTVIARLADLESEFWLRVELGNPPPMDHAHPTAPGLAQVLYPGTDGTVLRLSEDTLHWVAVWESAKAHRDRYQRLRDEARAHLDDLMGSAAIGILPDGSALYRKRYRRGDDGYMNLSRRKAPEVY